MNQPFDEKLLTDLRESPPEDFAHELYQKLRQQEPISTLLQTSPISLPVTHRHIYQSATMHKIAAGIGLVLLLSVLAVALQWNNSNTDKNGVRVESIPEDISAPIDSQNRLSLTEVQRFGTGSLQKLVWSDSQQLVAISTTGIFIYDRWLNLQHQIDTETPATDAQINPHFRNILAIVQNGNVVLMNLADNDLAIYDEHKPSTGSYRQVHWLPDGIRFIAANSNGSVDVLSLGAFLYHQEIVENDGNAEIYAPPFMETGVISIDVNFDGTQLVTVGADAAVKVWAIGEDSDLSLLAEMPSDFPIFSYVTYAPNDNRLVIAQDTLSVYEVDENGFNLRQSLAVESPFSAWDSNVSFDYSGDYLFFGAGSPPTQRIWHLPTDTTRTLAIASETEDVALGLPTYSPDGLMLATLGGDKQIVLWNIYEVTDSSFLAEEAASVTPVSGSFLHMAVSSQNIVAAVQLDGTIMLFDGNTGEVLFESNISVLPNYLTFSPDGDMLIMFGFDTTSFRGTFYAAGVDAIISGTVDSKTTSHMLETGETYSGVGFSTDGNLMLTGGTSLQFWDISNGVAIQHPEYIELQETMFQNAELNSEMGNQINLVAFSPDETMIAGMAGNILNVWDVQTGELRFSQYRRDFNQLLLSFTADGQYVITSNTADDPAIRFWNLDGEEAMSIPLPDGYGYAVISPDKSSLITITINGIQQWDIRDISAVGEPIDITPDDLTIEPSNLTAIRGVYSSDGEYLLLRWVDATIRSFHVDS